MEARPPRTTHSPHRLETWTRVVAWVGFLLLLVLHLDFWRPTRPVLYFGWIPEELLWRLGWMGLAFLYLVFFCNRVWSED